MNVALLASGHGSILALGSLSGIQRRLRRWVNLGRSVILPAAGLGIVSLGLAGCTGDHSTLDPAGPAAREVAWLWWAMFGVSTVVLFGVVALWLFTFWRTEPAKHDTAQEHRIARRWIIGGGLLLPLVSVVALLIFGVPVSKRMLPIPLPGGEQAMVIEVEGHQWWWEVRYPQAEEGIVVTANQLMLPVGEPIDFHVTSDDVIHSFWVPRLGGKIDMVPGRTNRIRLEADHAGTFGAQCAEFCGPQHAHMRLHVEALERDEFDAWIAARQAPPEQRDEYEAARGAFLEHCADCHRVAGVSDGQVGPDLTDLGSRAALGAGTIPMYDGAIADWLKNHQQLKPGNRMPAHDHLEAETLDSIAAWLETLSP